MASCCTPTLYAWFKREGLHEVGMRHRGPFCAGQLDLLQKAAWISQGRTIRTGEWIVLQADA